MRIPGRAGRAALVAVLVACAPRLLAEKRALLVGIDDYSASHLHAAGPLPPDRDWRDLDGARTDAGILRGLLVARYGFQPANIVTLTDQQATRGAILAALEKDLVPRTMPGDVPVFYFAGHGSQVRNRRSRERDKMDESLVPADSRIGAADIRDKELCRIFNRALDRGARLTVILDSCHSASGGRGFDASRSRGVRPDLRDVADGRDPGPRPENRGALILAAAQDFDLAYEARLDDGEVHGAFSWAFERALRDSEPSEPAIDTFLRAQARLRVDMPLQEPVIAGGAEARLSPMFSARGERRAMKTRIAVEKLTGDGTYVLQGGWVNGINLGSELRSGGVRLQVTALRGIARSEARPAANTSAAGSAPLPAGTLLDVSGWAAPPGRPLRVAIPAAPADMRAAALDIAREAERRGIRWVTDPAAASPAHLIRWRHGAWETLTRGDGGVPSRNADAAGLLRGVARGSSLFLELPVPPALREAILPSLTERGIELTANADSADYVLAGRLTNGQVEFAWLHRPMSADRAAALPLRSAWNAADAAETPLVLAEALSRLRRIFGWQHLESPPGEALPYRLAVRRASDGSLVEDGAIAGETRYELVLRVRAGAPPEVEPRYVYVFVVDSAGRSVLLFPLSGSVENRLPLDGAHPPAEIPLPASFTAAPPYGRDTYFLLATGEALPNPWALEWDGVRGAPPGSGSASPLQELLASGGTMRSLPITPDWSIEKSVFDSVAPRRGPKSGGTSR